MQAPKDENQRSEPSLRTAIKLRLVCTLQAISCCDLQMNYSDTFGATRRNPWYAAKIKRL